MKLVLLLIYLIIVSLQLHTSKDHPDYLNITKSLNKIRELYLFVKQVQERIENRNKMLEIQRSIINLPDIMAIGRYLVLEEKAILLNKVTYKFVNNGAADTETTSFSLVNPVVGSYT